MKYSQEVMGRMHSLVSNLSITNPTHTDAITMLQMEAKSIFRKICEENGEPVPESHEAA